MRSAGGASSHPAISVREGQVTSWESLVLVLARQKGEVGLGKVSWQSLGGFRARAFFCKNCLGMFIRTWDQISFLSCTFLYLRVAFWTYFVTFISFKDCGYYLYSVECIGIFCFYLLVLLKSVSAHTIMGESINKETLLGCHSYFTKSIHDKAN